MIPKAELLALAREWQLTPGVVEKDYVLGWMLAGVGEDTETAEAWVFKGGTCLRKCVLETYRFSEDLDFTLTPSAKYAEGEIAAALARITAWVAERSGLVFPAGSVAIRARQNRAGERTFEASVGYQGPLSQPGPPKIRFDITQHEPIVTPTVQREIFHPYSDALPERVRVTSYSTAELVAEKTRALFERSRPRDLYDVIQLGEIELPAEETARLRAVAVRKFESKGLNLPSASELESAVRANGELTSEWSNMLAHQLPALPALEDQLARLPRALAWLEETATRTTASAASRGPRPSAIPLAAGDRIITARSIRSWGSGSPIETIRFAAANRLLVEFSYHGSRRVVEPYSLRVKGTGNLLLYAWEVRKGASTTNDIRAYKVGEVADAKALTTSFNPRFLVEFMDVGGIWR